LQFNIAIILLSVYSVLLQCDRLLANPSLSIRARDVLSLFNHLSGSEIEEDIGIPNLSLLHFHRFCLYHFCSVCSHFITSTSSSFWYSLLQSVDGIQSFTHWYQSFCLSQSQSQSQSQLSFFIFCIFWMTRLLKMFNHMCVWSVFMSLSLVYNGLCKWPLQYLCFKWIGKEILFKLQFSFQDFWVLFLYSHQ
jgi:hypothetical protein